ncbi:hypothetical protein N0V85_008466 [Neurospora sp. IMI 360204]|nr:hypothetical protein N0V85_008466 [Neurospora sp. IMI 360204]
MDYDSVVGHLINIPGLDGTSQIDPAILTALLDHSVDSLGSGLRSRLRARILAAHRQAIHRRAAIEVPSPIQETPDQDGNVSTLQTKLNNAAARLQEIQDSLNPIVSQCGKDVVDKLEMAMTKLYKLAVFIRGDYDDREPDTTQRDELLKQAVQAFTVVENCAQAGLEKISRLHSQVMETENTVINPAKQEIAILLENNQNEVNNLQDQIKNSETSVNTMQNSLSQQSQAVSSLHDKISSSRDAKLASDIGFTILTFGIGNAINHGPLDPFNLQGQLDEANRLLQDAQSKYNDAANELKNLQLKRTALETRLSAARHTEALIPQVSTLQSTTNTNCIMLQGHFGPLKEKSAQLLRSVGKIQSDATVTQALAYSKKEFALGLLEISRDSLMDQALVHEASMVKDEVMNGYGGAVPDEVQEMASKTSERMEIIVTVPSIRAIE